MNRKQIYSMVRERVLTLRERGPVVLLDSQLSGHRASGKIYLAGLPRRILSFRADIQPDATAEKTDAVTSPVTDTGSSPMPEQGSGPTPERGSDPTPERGPGPMPERGSGPGIKSGTLKAVPWEQLRQFRSATKGMILGYLGYDLKNYTEDLVSANPDEVLAPDMWFMSPGILMEIDPDIGNVIYLAGDEDMLNGGEVMDSQDGECEKGLPKKKPAIGPVNSGMAYPAYRDLINEARRRIGEGDFYEINLTNQLRADFEGDTYDLFEAMREAGPVPFASYISGIDGTTDICCASPERFLARDGGRVVSEPIKGTVAAGMNAREDHEAVSRLRNSAKDQAENLMIVDLVRNDLGRIAVKGSVKVDALFEIQSFKTVHQMVSAISAEVPPASDPVSIIKACYPMGSMTGAPKISAMKSIEELENYRRGIYSGAIGYIKENGDFDFNVVIRTAVVKDGRLFYCTGGAITGDSDPELEWEESWIKARALLRVFGKKTENSISEMIPARSGL
ncbi:MAG: anthranilate synthase component I family protein [Rhodothermaceae bacterium]|nr:anthranilate synthase component I family protein [Rhodothermaceae bacterium]